MRAAGVTYEAVKRQLELLGHDVPDDAIHAYLKDLQKGSTEAPSSSRPGSQLSERPTVRLPLSDALITCLAVRAVLCEAAANGQQRSCVAVRASSSRAPRRGSEA